MDKIQMKPLNLEKIQFFFFGCWNKNGCKHNQYLRKIVQHINRNRGLYDFGVILGDNVYPETEKKHLVSTLKNGIDCINNINLPLYAVLGNHDITQCDIITEQAKNNKNWIFPKNYYAMTFTRANISVRLVVIDTNLLYDSKIYNFLINSKCILPTNIDANYDSMMKFLDEELADAKKYNWIIIAGHTPIASFKQKKTDTKPFAMPGTDVLINKFGSIPNLIYICADTHNFQYDIINSKSTNTNIKQIISGTGGATPDPIVPIFKDNKYHDIDGINRIMMYDTYTPYGYSDMIIFEKKIVIIYHQIYPEYQEHLFVVEQIPEEIDTDYEHIKDGNGFYFRKYLKYKIKYMKKLKNIDSEEN